jgi:hypothetical protein
VCWSETPSVITKNAYIKQADGQRERREKVRKKRGKRKRKREKGKKGRR